jgi:hypothetical protein
MLNAIPALIATRPIAGAELIRDRVRWAEAERRWHPPGACLDDGAWPPAFPARALREGALLGLCITHRSRSC